MPKILIVDDTPDVRSTLKGLLEDAGHTVETASNEAEALSKAVNPNFDLALIDVRLHSDDESDESGLSLTLAIRKLNPDIQIIVMTGFKPKPSQIVRAIRYHGAVDFIEKKLDNYSELPRIISEIRKDLTNVIRFSLSLENSQPALLRTYGVYICAKRTRKALLLEMESFAKRAENIWHDRKNFRFQAKEIGKDLWNKIFAEHQEIISTFSEVKGKDQLLFLKFETARDYLRLPFELMFSEILNDYLICCYPLTRFINNAIPKRRALSPEFLALKEKLRILIVASNTWSEDLCLPKIDGVDNETNHLYEMLKQQSFVEPNLISTDHATYDRIQSELTNCYYDIIHYAGHGAYHVNSPEESHLFFWTEENSQGGLKEMKASELETLLKKSEVRLVYLSCCQGTTTGDQTKLLDFDFLGIADAIVHAGIPSVLGYRWPVSDAGAKNMALEFYKAFLETGSPEFALWQARQKLDRNDPTWLSPILIHQQ